MASVHDVAAYIVRKIGPTTAMKLQKLVYYCQAWSLVWEEKPLFKARIEAWANGPVVPQLYQVHRGAFKVTKWPLGDPNAFEANANEKSTIDAVLDFYGKQSSQWLSDLTHGEDPWKNARQGLPAGASCKNEITTAAMAEYYGSL
jgi:uncharacterized phage-associated protein